MNTYDLVIKNASLISFDPDVVMPGMSVGIKEGVIHEISEGELSGAETIDAQGEYVSPGFIDFHSHVNGRLFSAEVMALQGATTTIGGERNFDAAIIRDIETNGFLINHGFYISYSFTLRRAVGIGDLSARAGAKQIEQMIDLTERFLDFGVLGIHLGLEYAPGTTYEEVVELLKLAKKHDRVAMVHLREDGYDSLRSLEEIINAASITGASVNILHVMYTAGLDGLLSRFLERIEQARRDGCDITADTGLYGAYPTFAGSCSLGGRWEDSYAPGVSEKNLLISSGVRIGDYCDQTAFGYIRREFPTTLITAFVFDERQVERAILPSYMMISTNAAYGPHTRTTGHPEGSGTFPKLLSVYVREKRSLGLHEAVRKITLAPAERIGLKNKGRLAVGYDADITIFNAEQIKSNSDYVGFGQPNAVPDGISYVIVRGQIVADHGTIVSRKTLPGRLIKHQK